MILKCSFILALFILNDVLAHGHKHHGDKDIESTTEKNVMTESDQQMVRETGCKYLHLGKRKSMLFTKDGGNLVHTTMALLSEETPADQQPKFKLNFAVQSDEDFRIFMFTRRHYMRTSKTKPDYKIGLGTNQNKFSFFFYTTLSERYESMQSYDLKNSTSVLADYKYEKFYININNGTLTYGKHCAPEPIGITDKLGLYRPEIVQIGFESKSDNGAKVLYDCPAEFSGCPA